MNTSRMAASAHLDHHVDAGPPWGSLALDCFTIDKWTSNLDISDGEQRIELVGKYLNAGSLGRKQYAERAARSSVKPTDAKVETILKPLRSSALRSVASTLTNLPDSSGPVWLRIDYENEERRQDFCRLELDCVDSGDGLREESVILSDEHYYNVDSWQKVLDYLPEIVVNHHKEQEVTESSYRGGASRRTLEREYMECNDDSEKRETILAHQQHRCVARFILIEDRQMYASDPPKFHALWLDDCGNVVRENRVTAEDACDYFQMAAEGASSEQEIWSKEASIRPRYVHGCVHGPPFSLSPGSVE